MGAQFRVLRHEPVADAVVTGLWKFHAEPGHLLAEEAIGDLDEHAGPVAHKRVCAHRASMRQVLQHGQTVLDDLV